MQKGYITLMTLLFCIIGLEGISQTERQEFDTSNSDYPKSLVSFSDFTNLVTEIEGYREQRLISLDTFIKMSNEPNTIILDTRSKYRYDRKHLKGAKHLAFTEFTQANLQKLIGDKEIRILIYCNNNFEGDEIDLASKIFIPNKNIDGEMLPNRKPIMLALNIPTFINLYGYGFKNIYELDELVEVGDTRIEFEGTQIFRALKVGIISLEEQKQKNKVSGSQSLNNR